MIRVLTAAPAELLKLQAIRSCFLVLGRYVIAALAIAALQYNVIAWHNLFSISDCQFPIFRSCHFVFPIGNQQLEIGNSFTRLHPRQYRRPPCGRLHESRSANLSPSQSARSTRSPSARCPQASPSRLPAASAPPR